MTEEEQWQFFERDEWEAEVNSWTLWDSVIYDRNFIINAVSHVPDWIFNTKFILRQYEDVMNEELMICKACHNTKYPGEVENIWQDEQNVDPFNFKEEIYEDERFWCAYCDKHLFEYFDL